MSESIHCEPEEPFHTPCCGIAMVGDIVFGETLCPYCEQVFQSEELPVGLDIYRHNEWCESLKQDVEFEPLRDFIDRLKE